MIFDAGRPRHFAAGAFILRAAAGIFCPARGGARPLTNPPRALSQTRAPVPRITCFALPYNSGMKFLLRHRALLSALGVILIVLTAFFCCFFALGSAASQTLKPVVVLDAGHGGIDAGVRGTLTGVKESDLNLSFVRILQEKFEAAGFEAVLTRKTEAGLYGTTAPGHKKRDMAARAAIVKEVSRARPLRPSELLLGLRPPRRAGVLSLGERVLQSARVFASIGAQPDARVRQEDLSRRGRLFHLKMQRRALRHRGVRFFVEPRRRKTALEHEYREKLASAIFEGALTYLSSSS